jgi:dolichol-phosphate mannosyltransferase
LDFSVIVPFYNEEAAAESVVAELIAALAGSELDWEAILVDDGSTDRTAQILDRAAQGHARCRVLKLQPNRGQGGALLAGFRAAHAPILGMMDGDGQNPPGELLKLYPLIAHADFVNGIRAQRLDSPLRRCLSRVANRVRGRLLGDGLTDAGCALKVFRREIAADFWPFPMLNPFMGPIARAAGYRLAERPVAHRARTAGTSKYGLATTAWRPLVDLLAIWWILRRRR